MVKVKNQTPVTVDKTAEPSSTVVQAVIVENLYDLQGRPAYNTDIAVKTNRNNTKPVYPNQIGFETDFISERNPAVTSIGDFWTTPGGTMEGNITSWVDPNVYSDTDNQQHAYSGRYYEADPTSRTDVTSAPGLPFQASTPQALRYAYGQYDTLPGADAKYSPPPQSSDITDRLKGKFSQKVVLADPENQSKNAYQTMVTRVPLCTPDPNDSSSIYPALYQISMTEIAGGAGFNLSIDNDDNFLLSNTQYQVTSKVDSIGNHIVRTIQHKFPNYYDSTNNIASSDKANFQMQTEIDALGRTTYDKGPDDQGNRIYYDVGGLLRFSQNADQAQVQTCLYYVYDGMGRLAQINGIPLSTWDINTLKTYLAIPNEVIPGSLLLRQYSYDNPTDSPFVGGNNTLGRLVQVDSWNCAMDLSSDTNGNTYYNNSRVTEVYNYDSRGRLAQRQLYYMDQSPANNGLQNVDNFNYTYNNLSQITQISGNVDSKYTVNYQYNLQGLLSSVSDQDNMYVEYVYNADGTLNSNTMPLTGYQTAYYYNTIKQLRSTLVNNTSNGSSLFGEILHYTNADFRHDDTTGAYKDGNIAAAYSSYTDSVGAQNFIYSYTYDSFKRLTQATASPADGKLSVMPSWQIDDTDVAKGYDSNGNIWSSSTGLPDQMTTLLSSYNPGTNQLNNINNGSSTHYYTPSGRVSLINPNPTMSANSVQNLQFTYDILLGRPINISSDNGHTTIIYDAAGERIFKSTNNMTIQYYRHGLQVLYEQLSYNVDEPANFIANYYYGLSGIVGGTYKRSGSTSLSTYNSIVDHLGSTRLIIDANGSNITYFNYDTWGNIVAGNSSDGAGQESPDIYAGITRYLYTGQEWDAETQLYNYHARQYDPSSYRFLTPDPMYQYTNPYTYVANNPINITDPTGMAFDLDTGLFMGDNLNIKLAYDSNDTQSTNIANSLEKKYLKMGHDVSKTDITEFAKSDSTGSGTKTNKAHIILHGTVTESTHPGYMLITNEPENDFRSLKSGNKRYYTGKTLGKRLANALSDVDEVAITSCYQAMTTTDPHMTEYANSTYDFLKSANAENKNTIKAYGPTGLFTRESDVFGDSFDITNRPSQKLPSRTYEPTLIAAGISPNSYAGYSNTFVPKWIEFNMTDDLQRMRGKNVIYFRLNYAVENSTIVKLPAEKSNLIPLPPYSKTKVLYFGQKE